MKTILLAFLLLKTGFVFSQSAENIIIITSDGLRWQEVFTGMDSAIANNPKYNQDDSSLIYKKYWAEDPIERRKKLMPFLWSTIEKNGQIYGNRNYGNKIDNANPYWFSYPGYNEIFTGYADTLINSNAYPPNPNTNLLEFLNRMPTYKNKVAAFGAWDAFDRILNEERGKFPVHSAFDLLGGARPTETEKTINKMAKDSYKPFGEAEELDVFTHYGAFNYLQTKKPKVLYIAYGETDEWAHSGYYRDYLTAATMVDKWIQDIWTYIQTNPQYKNKTAIFITTDHGRGDANKNEWTSHNNKIKDCNQIWMAAMGPGINQRGEVKIPQQWYQKQFAQTMAALLGLTFSSEHPVGKKIELNRD
ncbi:MAG: alkaline phosphatase family protein [Chitinophagaceae bacterium]|nr:alkaline phosphatase family protein [Chitinophagaceae bacterium]